MKVNVTFEFDENNLGQKWMNVDNLELLIYSDICTKKGLFKIVEYVELPQN